MYDKGGQNGDVKGIWVPREVFLEKQHPDKQVKHSEGLKRPKSNCCTQRNSMRQSMEGRVRTRTHSSATEVTRDPVIHRKDSGCQFKESGLLIKQEVTEILE